MHSLYEKANRLTDEVIAAALTVQKHFGIGVLESIYVRCLERELNLAGHETSREKSVSISYRGMDFDESLRYDLLVDNCLLVEAKACEKENMEIWRMQLLSYMKLLDKPLGLVMNFGNADFPRRGLKRVILKGADRTDDSFQTSSSEKSADVATSVGSRLPSRARAGAKANRTDRNSACGEAACVSNT